MAPDKYAYIRDQGRYRIESVDFGTFLEKRDAGVVLRNLKTDRSQQVSIYDPLHLRFLRIDMYILVDIPAGEGQRLRNILRRGHRLFPHWRQTVPIFSPSRVRPDLGW